MLALRVLPLPGSVDQRCLPTFYQFWLSFLPEDLKEILLPGKDSFEASMDRFLTSRIIQHHPRFHVG